MTGTFVTVHTDRDDPAAGRTFAVGESFDGVIEGLLPSRRVPTPAWVEQARRNAAFRQDYLDTHGALDAAEIADLLGSTAVNRRQAAYRLVQAGKVFSVELHGEQLFPAFQFDPDAGTALPQMAEVLDALPDGLVGWELAAWFDTVVFDHDIEDFVVPLDVLDEPHRLIALARMTAERWHANSAA